MVESEEEVSKEDEPSLGTGVAESVVVELVVRDEPEVVVLELPPELLLLLELEELSWWLS